VIAAGFGVNLVTESDIGANFSGLTYLELRDGTGPSRVGFSAHWRSDNDNPALANFLKLLGERVIRYRSIALELPDGFLQTRDPLP
jgi:DNA-binding transcriptional LysR family regulator